VTKRARVWCAVMLLLSAVGIRAQTIRNIFINRHNVFDSTQRDWFFGAPLANALHSVTRTYLIEDELLLFEGDEADSILLLETERNLRRTGLFSSVNVQTIGAGSDDPDSVDIIIETRDRWSLLPALLVGTGGGISNLGAKLTEENLLGTGTQCTAQALHRTENDIGWEGMVHVAQRRLFRSEFALEALVQANAVRTDQMLTIAKAYRTTQTPWAGGVQVARSFGALFSYADTVGFRQLPFSENTASAWISQSYGTDDLLFVTGALTLNNASRNSPGIRQAFDNTGSLLVSFSSLSALYSRNHFLNGYETEDVAEGGWGNVTLGRVFSLGNGGQTMWYIGGEARKSLYVMPSLYADGLVQGGSGFGRVPEGQVAGSRALYTFVGVQGIGHWRASDNLVLTARVLAQASWNWNAYRQLVLDFESGLRGYSANAFAGDNRMISNVELRWFPQWTVWIAGISGVAFYDAGTVWNQGTPLTSARFHNSVGIGVRLHNLKASGNDAIFRFDLAYNLDEHRFGGLIFTTNQLFSAFGTLIFSTPQLYGSVNDER